MLSSWKIKALPDLWRIQIWREKEEKSSDGAVYRATLYKSVCNVLLNSADVSPEEGFAESPQ